VAPVASEMSYRRAPYEFPPKFLHSHLFSNLLRLKTISLCKINLHSLNNKSIFNKRQLYYHQLLQTFKILACSVGMKSGEEPSQMNLTYETREGKIDGSKHQMEYYK
jgi:hypothetical protein